MNCNDGDVTDLTGLTPGNTYYVRVYTWTSTTGQTSTFDVCIGTPPPPPANDDCGGAEVLPVNPVNTCTNSVSGTVSGALDSGAASSCGSTYNIDDVWYEFVAQSTAHAIEINNATGSYTFMDFTVYSGNCGSLTEIVCSTSDNGLVGGLTVGNTYYVAVYTGTTTWGQDTDFDICTYPVVPPTNDECVDAIGLTVNPDYSCGTTTPGSITFATQSSQTEGCSGTSDDDVWFSFVATGSGHRVNILNASGSTTDMYHSVYSGNCGTMTELICSDGDQSDLTGLTPGNTYWVRVYTYTSTPNQNVNFDVCVGTPPPPPANDECADAFIAVINPDESCTNVNFGYTTGATASS